MWPKKPNFTFLDHAADMGIIVRHRDLEGLFETAASAMMHSEIKAVTYHQAHVGKTDDHWEARVIFDR